MASPQPLRLGVAGADGHTGRAVLALIAERADVELAVAITRASAVDEILGSCEAIIDFTTAAASQALATTAAARGGPALVIGSTGFTADADAAIARAAASVAIVKSGNFSPGINVLAQLVEQAARRLPGEEWDIEILEAHHRRKTDAPSGTALMLAAAAARGRGKDLAAISEHGRDGARARGAIGYASLRGGGLVGEHSLILAAEDEIITLSHSARDRRLFARGAIAAALWVRGKPPGLYNMADVLGFGR
ncbi:MAG TPA: 4-hydroxy-tetrahydrodipicolinate reductase [Caulobacteraceae bacterium]|jgi:4-hydroxy-tetrahydrodipicolinate reductase